MRVAIVGAGVIGAATALELARRGVDVEVLDRGEVGQGCSFGNAGWLTPCFATSLAAPGVLGTSLRWLLDPDSPFFIRPSFRIEWMRWLLGFALAATPARFDSGARSLVALSSYSLDAFVALDRAAPGSFGLAQRGLLLVAQTAGGLDGATRGARGMERHGIVVQVLSAAEVRDLEPAVRGEVAGGIFFPGAAHCEPLEAVLTLARAAESAGARFTAGAEVFAFHAHHSRIVALRTTRGAIEADQFVLATGAWSMALGRKLRVRLPVLGGKGYAVVVKPFDPAPSRPIKIVERRIAITPRDAGVRLAGTLELVDGDETITARRVDAIVRGSRTVLAVPDPPEVVGVWRGLRPCTPDGLPIIGFAPRYENLLIATGHQMCGLHTAPATGRLAADLLTGAPPPFDPAPFRADRF